MSRVGEVVGARLRVALATVLGAVALLLLPPLLASLTATTGGSPSTAVLAAVAVATVAVLVGLNRRLTAVLGGPPTFASRAAAAAPSYLADRVTDAAHHPVRPRAPGLV